MMTADNLPSEPAKLLMPARPPDALVKRPLLIFDGDCGFCRRCVRWMQKIAGDRADYAPSQEVGADFPSIPTDDFAREVKLVATDGRVYGGAEAVFRLMAEGGKNRGWGRPLWAYRKVPGFRWASETGYRFVATHRMFFSALTRWL